MGHFAINRTRDLNKKIGKTIFDLFQDEITAIDKEIEALTYEK